MKTSITTILMGLGTLLPLAGCTTALTGAGEMGIGYRSETTLFGYHTVDGDKEGKKSEATVDPEALVDLILKAKGTEADGESAPVESDTP
jgi:hypothetical protein